MQCKQYKDEECPRRIACRDGLAVTVKHWQGCCQYVNRRPSENPYAQKVFKREEIQAKVLLGAVFTVLIGALIWRLFQ